MSRIALPSYPARALHLVAVWAYAVSQPVFSLLQGNPEFLVVRGSTRSEVVVFAALLTFMPPLGAVLLELLLGRASKRAADLAHLVFLGAFVVPLALYALKRLDPSPAVALLGAAMIALAALVAYARARAVRMFLGFSVALPLGGLVSFVVLTPLAQADLAGARIAVESSTPVVLIVLDELPVSSLLAADGRIDEERYPNFARLAGDATWYPRATTVADHTTYAVPAILTGNLPRKGELPVLKHHPESLFTLLGESYGFRVFEPITHLCPRRYCRREHRSLVTRLQGLYSDVRVAYLHRVLPASLAGGLPSIDSQWGDFGNESPDADIRDAMLAARNGNDFEVILDRSRDQRDQARRQLFDGFLASIAPGEPGRTLHFLHILVPHFPWRFLPSGREYNHTELIDGFGRQWGQWLDDAWLVQQGQQQHLLQVGYTDRLLGRALRRLEVSGLYDRSLVVVTADHGASFIPGEHMRFVTAGNIADIGSVPLFVKYPGQERGRVDTRAAQTIDIVPTIADVLGIRLPWAVDGLSLTGLQPKRVTLTVTGDDGRLVRASMDAVERHVTAAVRRKSAFFGEGSDSLYAIGTHRGLLGRPVSALKPRASGGTRADFDGEGLYADMQLSSAFVPARITGSIDGVEIEKDVELAVAVNGRIAALTRPFSVGGKQRFSAMVDEAVFEEGFNRVGILAVDSAHAAPRLVRLGETSAAQRYALAADGSAIRLPSGRRALVEYGRIAGRVEIWARDADTVLLRGWAADLANNSLPDRVLFFASGRLVYAGETTGRRRDVAETQGREGLERAGWMVELPAHELRTGRLEVFAVRGSTASELPLPAGFPWR